MDTQEKLLAVFDQYKSQSGKALIVALLREINNKPLFPIESGIVDTLLSNISRFSNYRVTDKQLYRLAQAVDRNHIDLNQFLEERSSDGISGERDNNNTRGIVISRSDNGIDVLLSDGTTRFFSNSNYSPGIFVEIEGSNPVLSSFRHGQDDSWLERVWNRLAEKFEMGMVEEEALVIAGKKVQSWLVQWSFKKSHREDKERVYGRIIIL